jgi:sporulation inhibitor KapD
MKNIVSGQIRTFDEEQRIVSLYCCRRIQYFYLQRSLLNHIGKYLEIGRFIQFTVTNEPRMYKRLKVYTVDYVIKIMHIRYRKNIVYYDVKNIKTGTKKLINNLGNKMFLDLEMSMHPYKVDRTFTQEIIQVGYLLLDQNDSIIEKYDQIIQPTKHKVLSKRTLRFLDISQEDVDNGIPFQDFYTHFKAVLDQYDPAVIVWGRNDFLALRDAYKINRLPNLDPTTRYINLLKLHKNYFHLKNDLGLFNALNLYEVTEKTQAHNALEDALVTQRIFRGFRDVVNHKRFVDISTYQ